MMHSGQHNLLDLGIPLPRKWRQREGMLGQYWLVLGQYKLVLLGIRWGQQRACMPVYIGKSGDLVRWHRCLTHTQTTEYSATQLVQSLKFKRSHAIIVIKHLTYPYLAEHTSVVWAAVVVIAKKIGKNVGEVCWTKLEIGRRVGLLGSEKVEGETPATGWHSDHLGPDHICHSVAFWSYWSWSWSWSYLPQCNVAFRILIIMVTIISATRW